MLEFQQLPPMPGGGGGPVGGVGPSVVPTVSYAVKSYLPYLVVTVVMPLLGLLYIWLRTLIMTRRKTYYIRPDNTVYNVYLLAGLLPLIGGSAVLEKIVSDYVYGTTVPWRWINTATDMYTYMKISEFLSHFYLLAGVGIGLSLLLLLLYKYYENWYIDMAIYLGNLAWFLYLTPRPLARFKYTSNYIKAYNVDPLTQPFQLVSGLFAEKLAAGLIIGTSFAILAAVYYYRSRRWGKANPYTRS